MKFRPAILAILLPVALGLAWLLWPEGAAVNSPGADDKQGGVTTGVGAPEGSEPSQGTTVPWRAGKTGDATSSESAELTEEERDAVFAIDLPKLPKEDVLRFLLDTVATLPPKQARLLLERYAYSRKYEPEDKAWVLDWLYENPPEGVQTFGLYGEASRGYAYDEPDESGHVFDWRGNRLGPKVYDLPKMKRLALASRLGPEYRPAIISSYLGCRSYSLEGFKEVMETQEWKEFGGFETSHLEEDAPGWARRTIMFSDEEGPEMQATPEQVLEVIRNSALEPASKAAIIRRLRDHSQEFPPHAFRPDDPK